jgi:hypothetical protein
LHDILLILVEQRVLLLALGKYCDTDGAAVWKSLIAASSAWLRSLGAVTVLGCAVADQNATMYGSGGARAIRRSSGHASKAVRLAAVIPR